MFQSTPLAISLIILATILPTPITRAAQPHNDNQPTTQSATTQTATEEVPEQKSEEQLEKEAEERDPLSEGTLAALAFRSIGPALMSGRIGDFAINPQNPAHFFVAVASGNLWKTENAGTTWKPVFDHQGAYSIGCVTLDPNNPDTVWVGTGENNSQRSVSFGDGVYVSHNGGKSWKNVGLKNSEHIGMIAVHPNDPNTVYVAAQGPLWNPGGDRGLYKTTDGGQNWNRILHISENTGANEVHLDPRNPNTIYTTTYQRRRHVWTLINGGPESAIYKSADAGQNWRKLSRGIPGVDKGRIGLTISPADPDTLYAIIEAADGKGGVFRSEDRGESWTKRSSYIATSPQYYNELFAHPTNPDRLISLDTVSRQSFDGGKSWEPIPRQNRHVDDHAFWINPDNTDHWIIGGDGGVYQSHDEGQNWRFMSNLPVTQFYRISTDNSCPFYYVYGGTQDNSTLGGPSQTTDRAGITNADWFITVGGDGYETCVDPNDPNIVYSQWQYGGLVRHDRRSGETLDIKPREAPGEEPYRWNWDSPLILSPHQPTRLYYAANKLFRTNDRGDSWTCISPDLSRQIDRNKLEVMNEIQWPDAVAKHDSTSFYGNIVSLDESPLVEGLIYVGTDDGLIQVTEDGGQDWRNTKSEDIGLPELTYVSGLTASLHDPDVVYACFDDHKRGVFTPYVYCSDDRGKSWKSISGNLPERDVCYTLRQDHIKPELLFLGTEFGAYVTFNHGQKWYRLKGGIPTIAVRDIEIQRRESDLVAGTFGRGVYILDNYDPLRHITEESLESDVILFPIKNALRYIPRARIRGSNGRGTQGAAFYNAPNPPFGAIITYYLKEKMTTLQEDRKKAEREADKADQTLPYPTIDDFRAEDRQRTPSIIIQIHDDKGQLVRRLTGPRGKGIHRVAWDLRYPSTSPVPSREPRPGSEFGSGPLVTPGTYTATIHKRINEQLTQIAGPEAFKVIALDQATFAANDPQEVLQFQHQVAELLRIVRGTTRVASQANDRLQHLRNAAYTAPDADPNLLKEIRRLELQLADLRLKLTGDPTKSKRNVPQPPTINGRVSQLTGQWRTTSPPTQTQRNVYRWAREEFDVIYPILTRIVTEGIPRIEDRLEAADAPWTPGRLPTWPPDQP